MSLKNDLPDSLELLLDTMCNTFGGVMFITLSMSLMVFMCHKALTSQEEKPTTPQELEELTRQAEKLEAEIKVLDERVAHLEPQQQVSAELQQVYNDNFRLEQENKKHDFEARQQEAANKVEKRKVEALERKNDENARTLAKAEEVKAALEKERKELDINKKTLKSLETKLSQEKGQRLHFAREMSVSQRPLWCILENGVIYKSRDPRMDQKEIAVTELNSSLLLRPRQGWRLSANTSEQVIESLFKPYPQSMFFMSFWVHPNSLEQFVTVRRHLRSLGYKVSWSVSTSYALEISSNVNYTGSN